MLLLKKKSLIFRVAEERECFDHCRPIFEQWAGGGWEYAGQRKPTNIMHEEKATKNQSPEKYPGKSGHKKTRKKLEGGEPEVLTKSTKIMG